MLCLLHMQFEWRITIWRCILNHNEVLIPKCFSYRMWYVFSCAYTWWWLVRNVHTSGVKKQSKWCYLSRNKQSNYTVQLRAHNVWCTLNTGVSWWYLTHISSQSKGFTITNMLCANMFFFNTSPMQQLSNGAGPVSWSWDGLKTNRWSDKMFRLDGCERDLNIN